jgi:hypothetical protein
VVALGITQGASVALAQASLDVPSLRVTDTGRTRITVQVEAGASGAPAGFTVQWMTKADYDRLGGWPADGDGSVASGVFTGIPTLNPSTGSYQLQAGGDVTLELGNLFDETGLVATDTGELPSGEEFIFRVRAEPTAEAAASEFSSLVVQAATKPIPPANCVYTQGFWKNHGGWPVGSLTLGTVSYTAAELLSIFNEPAAGNGLLILAHQLIATKLNIANGADPSPVAADIAAADALIGGLVAPPVGSDNLAPAAVTTLEASLDAYNNGLSGVPHCGEVSTHAATWGRMKASYR